MNELHILILAASKIDGFLPLIDTALKSNTPLPGLFSMLEGSRAKIAQGIELFMAIEAFLVSEKAALAQLTQKNPPAPPTPIK